MRPLDEMFADPDPEEAEKNPELMADVFALLQKQGAKPDELFDREMAEQYAAWLTRKKPSRKKPSSNA
jgi:hypothetical protein